MKQKFRK